MNSYGDLERFRRFFDEGTQFTIELVTGVIFFFLHVVLSQIATFSAKHWYLLFWEAWRK